MILKTYLLLPLVFFSAVGVAQQAQSQTQTPKPETRFTKSDKVVEEVEVIGTPLSRLSEEQTSMTGLVGKDVISQADVEHPSQLLNTVPGVWVHRGSGQEYLMSIRSPVFTGAGACGAFWLGEDGIALRSAGFCNVNQLFDAHTETAEQIAVFKGPQSTYFGSNAQFGGVNVTLPAADKVDTRLSLGGSSRGFRQLHSTFAHDNDHHHFASLLTLKEDDGWRDDYAYKQQKWSLKHAWRRGWTEVETGLTLVNLEQETAGYIEGLGAYKDPSLRTENAYPEAYRDAQALRLYSRLTTRKVDTETVITPYLRSNNMAFLMHFVPWQPTEENGHNAVGIRWLRKRYLTQGLEVYWGAEGELTQGYLKEKQAAEAPFGAERFPIGSHYDYEVDAQHAAVFIGAFMPNSLLGGTIDMGLRYDVDQYDYTTRLTPGSACDPGVVGCRFYRPEDRKDDFSHVTAHLGYLYPFNDALSFFSKISRGFRLPQTSELYRAQSDATVFPESEINVGVEVGLRFAQRSVSAELAMFAMRNSEGIYQDPQRVYVNGVDTQHQGLEYRVEKFFADRSLVLNINGTVASHTYENNPTQLGLDIAQNIEGNDVDSAPSQTHQLSLTWHPSDHWQHGMNVSYVGEYELDPENTFEYPGHTVTGLESEWQANAHFSIRAGVHNLTNRLYADRADVSFGTPRYFPAAERTVYLKVTYRGR